MYVVIILIIMFILSFFITYYSDLKEKNNVANISLDQINMLLTDKEKNINDLLNTIKNKNINRLQKITNNMSVFEVEKILYDYRWEINKVNLDEYLDNDKIYELVHKINIIDESIDGLKDFYNTTARLYNEKFDKMKFIFKFFKFENKLLFEIRKIDNYEILKN